MGTDFVLVFSEFAGSDLYVISTLHQTQANLLNVAQNPEVHFGNTLIVGELLYQVLDVFRF